MRLQTFVIGVLLVGLVMTGAYKVVNGISSGYGVEANESQYEEVFNQTEELNTKINDNYDRMRNLTLDQKSQFFTGVVIAVSMMKDIMVTPVAIMSTVISSFGTALNLPGWVITTVLSFVFIVVLFGMINMILRWKT